jgi:DNA-directed RNA polymerase subunit M/transcription elongation factor TFIIS
VKFCEECGALLVPKKEKKTNKVTLVCRSCGNKSTPEEEEVKDYVIASDLNHVTHDKFEVIKEKSNKVKRVTNDDREAFEDFFEDDSNVESY